jgi:signal transduction histidine kinase
MEVRLTVDDAPCTLPPALELSAFRVVQEALTNVLKHARATVASVGISFRHGAVDIEVLDDGVATGTPGGGHGLVGMRERVALYGGELEFGPAPEGGFRLHALLPVQGEAR